MPYKDDFLDDPIVARETLVLDEHFNELKSTINQWLSAYGTDLGEAPLTGTVDRVFVDSIDVLDINDIIIGLSAITTYIENFEGTQNDDIAQTLGYCPTFDNKGCLGAFAVPNVVGVKSAGDIIRATPINEIREDIQTQQMSGCYSCHTCHDYQNPVCNACFDLCYSYSGGEISCYGGGGYLHCDCGYNGGSWSGCHGWDGAAWCEGPSDGTCPSNGPYSIGNCNSVNSCTWPCNNYNHNGGIPPNCACGHSTPDTSYNFNDRSCSQCYQVGYRYPWNLPTYTLSYNTTANGIISAYKLPSSGTRLEESVLVGGNSKQYLAIGDPPSAYNFTKWSDGSTENPRQDVSITNNISVTASFNLASFTFYYGLCGDQNGVLVGDLTQTIEYGNNGTLVSAFPIPPSAYEFKTWSDTGTQGTIIVDPISGNVGVRQEINVQQIDISGVEVSYISALAEFGLKLYTLEYVASSDGTLYTEICGYSDTIMMYNLPHYSDAYPITAVADGGFTFSTWTDSVLLSARQDTSLSGNLVVSAVFV